MESTDTIETDVLVVGGGMAGLWAAIRAKDFARRVIVAEKAKVGRSGVSVFCHGYLAPLSEEMKEPVMTDIIERAAFLADQRWLRALVEENGDRVRELESWGAIFQKDEKKAFKTDQWTRGWKVKAWALAEGKQVIDVLRREALKKGVELVERTMVTDLLTSDGQDPTDGQIVGAVGLNTRSGQFVVFRTKSVVLTTGGASAKLHLGYADNVTGDGQAMGYRAGGELGGMEVSASNTFSVWNRRFTTGGQGQFQTEGAKLVNRLGEEFLKENYKDTAAKEFIGFAGQNDYGDLCRAIAIEILEGRGPVFFDLRAWKQEKIDKMRKVLPFTMRTFDASGIDIRREMVETTPMVGLYCMSAQSGLKINLQGETNIKGLLAAGTTSMVARGALTQSLCMVVGYRAGEHCGRMSLAEDFLPLRWEQVRRFRDLIFAPLYRDQGASPGDIYRAVNKTVTPFAANLFREEKRICTTIEEIRKLATDDLPRMKADDTHQLVKANEARNFVLLMELVYLSALERKESRLAHYREDYPYRDDENWIKYVQCKRTKQGNVQVRTEPVDMSYLSPFPRLRIPSPIQYNLGDSERSSREM